MINLSPLRVDYLYLLVFLGIFFTSKFFLGAPFQSQFLIFHAFFLTISSLYFLLSIFKKEIKISPELYFVFLSLFSIFYGSTVANLQFDQPIIYGILSQRGWLITGFLLFLTDKIVLKKISFEQVHSILKVLALGSMILGFLISIFKFGSSNIVEESLIISEERGSRVRITTYFMVYAIIYYFIKLVRSHNKISTRLFDFILFIMLALYFVLIFKARIYLLLLFLILIIMSISLARNQIENFKILIKIFFFVIVSLSALSILNNELISFFYSSFLNILNFQDLLFNNNVDSSLISRALQFQVVFDYISINFSNFLFGTGSISTQWNGGLENLFNYRLHPSDLGLFGLLFKYGFIGIIFYFIIPLKIIISNIKKIDQYNSDKILAIKFWLIFILLKSLFTGVLFFSYHEYLLPFFLLRAKILRNNFENN